MKVALLPDKSLPSGSRVHAKILLDLQFFARDVVITIPGETYQKQHLIEGGDHSRNGWLFDAGQIRAVGKVRQNIWKHSR